jgi:hypothetical protein
MNAWTRIIGVIVALYAGYSIYRGRVTSGDETSTTYIERSKNPTRFWIAVAFMFVVAAALIFNVFHF